MPGPNQPRFPGYPALRELIDASPFAMMDVAAELDPAVDQSTLSRWLDGTRQAPADLEDRVRAALGRLDRALKAARAALRDRQPGNRDAGAPDDPGSAA